MHESCQCIQCFPRWKKTKPQRNATHRIADLCSRHANDDDDAGVLENWGAGELGSWRRGGAGEAYRRDGATHGIEFEAFIYFFCEGDGGRRLAVNSYVIEAQIEEFPNDSCRKFSLGQRNANAPHRTAQPRGEEFCGARQIACRRAALKEKLLVGGPP